MRHEMIAFVALLFASPCAGDSNGHMGNNLYSNPHTWIQFDFYLDAPCVEELNSTFFVPMDYCMLGNFSRGESGELGRVMTWHRWTCNGSHVFHHEFGNSANSLTNCRNGNWQWEVSQEPALAATNYTPPNGGKRFCGVPDLTHGTHWNVTCDVATPSVYTSGSTSDYGLHMGNCSQQGSGTSATYTCGYDRTGFLAGVVHFPAVDCTYNTNGTHRLDEPNGGADMIYESVCIPGGLIAGASSLLPSSMTIMLLFAAILNVLN